MIEVLFETEIISRFRHFLDSGGPDLVESNYNVYLWADGNDTQRHTLLIQTSSTLP